MLVFVRVGSWGCVRACAGGVRFVCVGLVCVARVRVGPGPLREVGLGRVFKVPKARVKAENAAPRGVRDTAF